MQKAKVFLMTINWYEPFGLVMAEAMSCGTPVIGFDRGAVKELIVEGRTGFVVPPEKGIEGLKEALSKIDQIKPQDCRNHIVNNFSTEKMVDNYEKTYLDILRVRPSKKGLTLYKNHMKKIALLHYAYPPNIGGVEILIREHAKILSEMGYQVSVITGDGEEKNPK